MPNGESWLLFTDQHLCFLMTAYDRQCYFNEMVGLPWYCSAWTWTSKWKLVWKVGWRESSVSTGDCGKTIALHSAQYRHLRYSCFSCSWRNPFLVMRHTEKAWITSLICMPFLDCFFFSVDVKAAEILMQTVHPCSLKTPPNVPSFKHLHGSWWFMYLDLYSSEYFKRMLQCTRLSAYPHHSPGFYVAVSVHIHVLTWTIRLIGRNET